VTLPDINVWLAAAWARHVHHDLARAWVDRQSAMAFCRVTEMGLLRLLSSTAILGSDVRTRRQAWDVVEALEADPRVQLLAEPPAIQPIWRAFSKKDDASHLLWTDDYLAAFAVAADVELSTLDRALVRRYPTARVAWIGRG
jgi:toxin-antitoxin system PIN domain toxin